MALSHRKIYSTAPDDATLAASLHASTSRRCARGRWIAAELPRPGQDAAADAAAMAEFQSKEMVWVPDSEKGFVASWVIGRSEDNETRTCMGEDDKTRTVSIDDVARMNPPQFERVEDIANLTHLNEPSVVHNLRARYQKDQIYTWSGLFLVAVNPYRLIPHMYTPAAVAVYQNRRREDNAPHVFAVAQQAWQSMVTEGESQSILVTGESGAGKTENTKKVIQYLAAVAADPASHLPQAGSESSLSGVAAGSRPAPAPLGRLERQILDANPILEAFGNAQTIKNDNSSRFGKFVKIEFTPVGAIAGASIEWYLLEKARVTNRHDRERSFHVFYQLLRGADQALRDRLLLTESEVGTYAYLSSSATSIPRVDDRKEWADLLRALDTVGVTPEEQLALFKVVAAVLLLGNLAIEGSSHVYIKDDSTLDRLCQLLGVAAPDLKRALSAPRIQVGSGVTKEVVAQARTREQVLAEAGALAKTLYERQFGALVTLLNRALDQSSPGEANAFIGVLDIAGFEIFERNSFEQLCINLTNERLQQFFNHHMFVLEQDLYEREGIAWSHVDFALNSKPTIDLIESNQPIGILAALDDACVMANASDVTFTQSLHDRFSRSSEGAHTAAYAPAKYGALGFVVAHYAGKVQYDTKDWLGKNKDPLNSDLTAVLARATNRHVANFFSDLVGPTSARPTTGGPTARVKKGVFRTVGQRHREQLATLMGQLQATQPHFVRCIVPNLRKRPGVIDVPLVLDQLRCNGVVEGIRIARLGYPNRLAFTEFRNRYEVLVPGVLPPGYIDGRAACERMTAALELDSTIFRVGRSKVFFKAGVLAELEQRRDGLLFGLFTQIQAACRRFNAVRRLHKHLHQHEAILIIQRNARAYLRLKKEPWWQLYQQLKPELAAGRSHEVLRKKEQELAEARARAEREEAERQRLLQLEQEHRVAYKAVNDDLVAARALTRDQAAQIQRLGAERDQQQRDLDEVEGQLDRLLDAEQAAEDKATRLKAQVAELTVAITQAHERMAALEAARAAAADHVVSLGSEAAARQAEQTRLAAERDALAAQIAELRATIQEREEDLRVARSRTQAVVLDFETKLKSAADKAVSDREAAVREFAATAGKERDELARSVEAYEQLVSRHEADGKAVQTKLTSLRLEHEAAQREAASLRQQLATTEAAASSAREGSTRDADALRAMQATADQLRALLDTKASEETRRGEAIRLKDEELSRLRSAAAEATHTVLTLKQQHATEVAQVNAELRAAQTQAESSAAEALELRAQLESGVHRLSRAEAAAADAAKARIAADSALLAAQLRLKETGAEADAARKDSEALQRRLNQSALATRQAEDLVRETSREGDAVRRQLEQLKAQIALEAQHRADAERSQQAMERETSQLRQRTAEAERQTGGLTQALQAREAELAYAVSLQVRRVAMRLDLTRGQDKTIVEHVHVLEKAKKFTDAQLKETRAALTDAQAHIAKLEKTRKRLHGENEDLQRALGGDGRSNTVYIKQDLHAPPGFDEQLSKERKAKETAEASLRIARTDLRAAHEKMEAATLRAANLEKQRSKLEAELVAIWRSPPPPPGPNRNSVLHMSEQNAALLRDIAETEARAHQFSPTRRPKSSGSRPVSMDSKGDDADLRKQIAAHNVSRQLDQVSRLVQSSTHPSTPNLQREVARLQELLLVEASARDAAESAHLRVAETLSQQSAGAAAAVEQRHGALEEQKRSLQAQARTDKAAIDELKHTIQTLQRDFKQAQAQHIEAVTQLEVLRLSHSKTVGSLQSAASTGRPPLRAMQAPASSDDMRTRYDQLSRHAADLQSALDEAELNGKRDRTFARTAATEQASRQADTDDRLQEASTRLRHAETRVRQLERELEATRHAPSGASFDAERQALHNDLEAERRARAADHDALQFSAAQLQAKYQASLESATLEANSSRAAAIRAREEAHAYRTELDALQLKYDEDTCVVRSLRPLDPRSHFLESWLAQREALESKLSDLRSAYDKALLDLSSEHSKSVAVHSTLRDTKLSLEDAIADRNSLHEQTRKLQQQLARFAEENQAAMGGRASSDRQQQALRLELDQARVAERTADARAAREASRCAQAEDYAQAAQHEAAQARAEALATSRANAHLEAQRKQLSARLLDLESRPAAVPTQRSSDARVAELESALAAERQRTRELLVRGRSDDATAAQLLEDLQREAKERTRLTLELEQAHQLLSRSRADLGELQREASRFHLMAREAQDAATVEREQTLRVANELERVKSRMDRAGSPSSAGFARGSPMPSSPSRTNTVFNGPISPRRRLP